MLRLYAPIFLSVNKMRLSKIVNTLIVLTMIAAVLIVLVPNINLATADTAGTFGNTSVGGTRIGTGAVAAKTGGYFQLTTSASVSKISAYVSGSGYAKCAIYSDSNGNPGSPIGGATSQISVSSSAGWVDFWYSSPVSLSAGYYWLVLIYNGDGNWYYSSGGVSAWNYVSYSSEPVSPFGTHTDRSDLISIYATYTTSSSSSSSSSGSAGTFGRTSVGGTRIGTGAAAAKTGGYFQLTTSASVTKITAYISGYGNAKCAIYSDSNGNPGSPIGGATSQISVSSSAGWVDFWYSSPVSLSAGYYWLVLIYESGGNWYYSSGGVSAWNYVSYYSEPVSPFGTHTDRSDLISIYATYTTTSSSTPTPTSTPAATATPTPTPTYTNPPSSGSTTTPIQRSALVYGYSWTSSYATYAANNLDLLVVDYQGQELNYPYGYYMQQIKNQNPDIIILGYKPLLGMCTTYEDWNTVNAHEDWFVHDSNGYRVYSSYWRLYLMDVGSAGWRQHWTSYINNKMATYPAYDGVYADCVYDTLDVTSWDNSPPSWVYSRWHADTLGMIQYVKANLWSNKLVVVNTEAGWAYGHLNYDYLNAADGMMIEGYYHCAWESSSSYSKVADTLLTCLAYGSANGKIMMAISGSTSNDARLQKFTYAEFLLGMNGPRASWGWAVGNIYDNLADSFPSVMSINIGSPTGTYYKSQNVYIRDFTGGKVISNPTGNYYTISLGGYYRLQDGSYVSSVSLSPYTAEILWY
jgi:hypothetical protein